jgi:hypothetical protein
MKTFLLKKQIHKFTNSQIHKFTNCLIILILVFSCVNIQAQSIAMNKTVIQNNYAATYTSAIDGSYSTLCSVTGATTSVYFVIDLGSLFKISSFTIQFGTRYPISYGISVKNETATSYTELYLGSPSTQNYKYTINSSTFKTFENEVRYVKIQLYQYQTYPLNFDLTEFELFGTPFIIGAFDRVNVTNLIVSNKVGIGTSTISAPLTIKGKILAEEFEIVPNANTPSSDYVFDAQYELMQLTDLEQYVATHKHLPEVPSATEFKQNGYKVGQMDDLLLRKVEELTLYTISLSKQLEEVKTELAKVKGGK